MSRPVDGAELEAYPALTFYYGIGPTELVNTPRSLLRRYLEQLPMLLARAQLERIQAAAVPWMADADRGHYLREIQARAEGGVEHTPQVTLKEFVEQGGGFGLGVTRADTKAAV